MECNAELELEMSFTMNGGRVGLFHDLLWLK
jgi:hypothetical protein